MNYCSFSGNLAKAPEIRYTQSGKAVCSFTVGVNSGWGDNKRTDWLPVIAWNKTAEACANNLDKGSKVLVEGRIQTRSYDAKDGSKRYVTEFVAGEVEFLSPKKQGAPQAQGAPQEQSIDEQVEIPF